MNYQTFLFRYKIIQNSPSSFSVVRQSWLWGIPTKYLDRLGNFTYTKHEFSDSKAAEIRLVKYLQDNDLF